MAKKYSVSLPDALAARLEQTIKDRVSLSELFRNAVEKAVSRHEEVTKRMKEEESMEEIIARLKKQKEETEKDFFEQGEQEGLTFAKTADYEDLKFAATVYATSYKPWLDNKFDGELDSYFEEFNELEDFDDQEKDAWYQGWCYAVSHFWDSVKSQL